MKAFQAVNDNSMLLRSLITIPLSYSGQKWRAPDQRTKLTKGSMCRCIKWDVYDIYVFPCFAY